MKIAVFCSANKNIDPDFFTLTEEMGKWMAENGHDLVFGGCNSGLMDCIGKAVKANGGRTIGVVEDIHSEHPTHGYRWVAAYIRINLQLSISDNFSYKCFQYLGIQSQTRHKIHYKLSFPREVT